MNNISKPEGDVSSLSTHLKELRRRVLFGLCFVCIGFATAYFFKEDVFSFFTKPLVTKYGQPQLVFTAVHELFFTYIKISFLCGLFFGLPFLLNQLWKFVSPGLYQEERRTILPFLLLSPALFYGGGAFSYFLVMPLAIEFFFSFATAEVAALPSVKEYLAFFIKLSFGFGFAFQLPVVLVLCSFFKLVTVEKLRWFRRYAWVVLFVFAALLTPPDPLSQILLALPMVFLYEVGILLVHMVHKK